MQILHEFCPHLGKSPPGSYVRMANRIVGVVTMVTDAGMRCRMEWTSVISMRLLPLNCQSFPHHDAYCRVLCKYVLVNFDSVLLWSQLC